MPETVSNEFSTWSKTVGRMHPVRWWEGMPSGFRTACLLLVVAGALAMPRPAVANPIVPVTLGFEREGLDLDTGTVVPIEHWTPPVELADLQPDLVLTCNSERTVRAVVFHNRMNGVQVAFLDGVAFNVVDSADLAGLSFTAEVVDKPFETGDSVVLRTDTGAHYLAGNPIEDASAVTFDTQLLDETTAGLVRPVAEETILARGSVTRGEVPLSASPSLPPGLSAGDWRQIRGLIEEDGYSIIEVEDAGAVYPGTIDPTVVHEDAKLTASDAAASDRFGVSVALSGDTVVVGAHLDDHAGGARAGSAYVFVRSGTSWSEQAKLTASDAAAFDRFGVSVALSGDTAVVGAFFDTDARGSAYVFVRSGTSWSEQVKLTASDAAAFDGFGSSVALSGDTAVVGSLWDDHAGGTDAGSASVFVRSGTNWSEQAKLTASDAAAFDGFGSSVALSGDTAVVGAFFDTHASGTDAGSAYVFVRSGTSWSEQAKLTANDAAADDRFGSSVALSGDTAVVGAFGDDHAGGTDAGSAYVLQFNQPPVALCTDVTVSAGPDCTADASIDAGSFDADDEPITLSQDPLGPYGLGDTPVTLTATDDRGASATCTATVTVEDTTPPAVTVSLDPNTLWPPNHRMVDVGASWSATDNCGVPNVVVTSVTSNEADNGEGDGNTVDDIQGVETGTADAQIQLRAERAGGGSGRIYTTAYTATDAAGNTTTEAGFAIVPHDQGGAADPIETLLDHGVYGTWLWWSAAAEAESYDVIRGDLRDIVETEVVIDLGGVTCIEAASGDTSTVGFEDSEAPAPGEAFFYLVEYFDGTSSSYGTESASKPRAPAQGACQ